MEEFSECIFDLNLVDLPLARGTATWSNKSWSRLDCFLISPEWESHFLDVWQKRMPRIGSDHWPIMLDCGDLCNGHQSFKFENMWLKSEGFVDRVKQWWSSYQFQDTPSFILASKLKALKRDLRVWNVESFDNVGENKKIKLLEIQEFERLQAVHPLSQEELVRKAKLIADVESMILLEQVSWRQKSRALWLQEGDRSTRFSHRIANLHRKNNNIEMLKIDGVECRDEQVIHNHVVDFYENLLAEQVGWWPPLNGLGWYLTLLSRVMCPN
ncbi:uncharacterized protein LOC122310767 [Carya illinoinensis]|uniref:uncharacterized protein LOC122310767 n=1 Tax=Carya illinoinensis TaxID=32201 RepID=UPI001C7281D6|nr:uncharacterized protein LOC122310767 [Carya illinoinensis]